MASVIIYNTRIWQEKFEGPQKGNQKAYIEEQAIQKPKEKVQKGKITIYKILHRIKLTFEQHEPH